MYEYDCVATSVHPLFNGTFWLWWNSCFLKRIIVCLGNRWKDLTLQCLSILFLADCYRGLGRGYNGTISTTKSNKTCQRWSEQAPHQFILPSSQYPELAGDHNYCRNPGSRAPNGPWCFTTDPDIRWEYCDVPKCGEYGSIAFYGVNMCIIMYTFKVAVITLNCNQLHITCYFWRM